MSMTDLEVDILYFPVLSCTSENGFLIMPVEMVSRHDIMELIYCKVTVC